MFSKIILVSLALGVLSVNALKFTRERAEYSALDSNWLKREPEPSLHAKGSGKHKHKPKSKPKSKSKSKSKSKRAKNTTVRPTKPNPHWPKPPNAPYVREPGPEIWDEAHSLFGREPEPEPWGEVIYGY